MRCRNACRSSCGPASWYSKRSSQLAECSRKNCWKAASSFGRSSRPSGRMYHAGCSLMVNLGAVGQLARDHFPVDGIGDGELPFGLDQPQVAHIGDVVGRDGGRLLVAHRIASTTRRTRASRSLSASWSRWVTRRRIRFFGFLDHRVCDGLAAVAPRLVSPGGLVGQRIDQPGLAQGQLPNQVQRLRGEKPVRSRQCAPAAAVPLQRG